MVIAKTAAAHAFLKEQFHTRSVEKEYLAYVYGHPEEDSGVIEAEIRRTRSMPPRWTAEPGGSKKRAAVTEWKVLKRGMADGQAVSFMKLKPQTGRTHQVRVHLKFLHHPVVCDPLYAEGKPSLLGFARPALHAHRLTLTLSSGERKTFEAPLPADFVVAEQALS
jgi:23S rRNA-/tRNA-specific pseudouridylate synthase